MPLQRVEATRVRFGDILMETDGHSTIAEAVGLLTLSYRK